jgi:hypothetical protein
VLNSEHFPVEEEEAETPTTLDPNPPPEFQAFCNFYNNANTNLAHTDNVFVKQW